ncbi:MAG: hypothetical protein AW07_01780 [Candidatus Accumulibacter sp. SK-11]|nr:MAG: hypothetical protein AW07_01780 [Candidatus Accumulibacter sp. SK-11]
MLLDEFLECTLCTFRATEGKHDLGQFEDRRHIIAGFADRQWSRFVAPIFSADEAVGGGPGCTTGLSPAAVFGDLQLPAGIVGSRVRR